MTRQANFDAVTFDFWNTIAAERPGYTHSLRVDRVAAAIAGAGIQRGPDEIEASVADARNEYFASWRRGTQFTSADAAHQIAETLRLDSAHEPFKKGLYEAVSLADVGGEIDLAPAPGIHEALGSLKAGGVRLGIICDVGLAPSSLLRAFLKRTQLIQFFDAWSFSDEVGHYKPAAEIFSHALTSLGGIASERAAHVGDIRRTDIAGAKSFGMTALRYRGLSDDQSQEWPEADHVIDDHRHIPALVAGSK